MRLNFHVCSPDLTTSAFGNTIAQKKAPQETWQTDIKKQFITIFQTQHKKVIKQKIPNSIRKKILRLNFISTVVSTKINSTKINYVI